MTAIITRTDALSTDNGSSSVKGATLTHTELDRNFYPIKIATDGTVEAGKAIIADANKDITGLRHATLTGTLTAEQITSTDDMTVTDSLSVGGSLTVTGSIISDSVPAGNFFGGKIASSGATSYDFGPAFTSSRVSTGLYRITPGTTVSNANQWIVTVTPEYSSDVIAWVEAVTAARFDIRIVSRGAGNNTNTDFSFMCVVGA